MSKDISSFFHYAYGLAYRLTAVGFILLVVFANLWLAKGMFGKAGDVIGYGFGAGALATLVGGLMMLGCQWLIRS